MMVSAHKPGVNKNWFQGFIHMNCHMVLKNTASVTETFDELLQQAYHLKFGQFELTFKNNTGQQTPNYVDVDIQPNEIENFVNSLALAGNI